MQEKRKILIALREKKNLRREDVASAIGVTYEYILMLEQGTRNPSLRVALALEDLFGVPASVLFSDVQRKPTGTESN